MTNEQFSFLDVNDFAELEAYDCGLSRLNQGMFQGVEVKFTPDLVNCG